MTAAPEPRTAEVPYLRTRVATFKPKREDDLRPDALAYVGETMQWRGLWVVSEEDGGPYVGQTVWEPADETVKWFGWVPDEDLAEVHA